MRRSLFVLFTALAACSSPTPSPDVPDSGAALDASSDVAQPDVPSASDVQSVTDTPVVADPEAGWNQILALPNVWAYRARDAYRDSALTQRVTNNDEVGAFRALGTGIPSVNNVPNTATLLWEGSTDFQSPSAPVWYASFGRKPTFVDRGNHDEYVRFVNGLPTNYETQPGQLTPPVARGEDYHVVHLFRTMPGASYEGLLAAPGYKDRSGDGNQMLVLYNNTNLFGTTGKVTRWGEDNIVELQYHSNGDVELTLNGEQVLSGNIPSLPASGFVEFVIGTNSHITSHHFRAVVMRKGGFFSAQEIAMIRANTNALWPRGVKPSFPYLDGQYRNNWSDWNNTTKTFQPAVGTFSGGNGTAGTHRYQWYYWTDPGAGSTWPRNNKLDYHLAFPGPRGQMATLRRADYEAGNTYGNPVVFAQPGTRTVAVMRVVTPVDSAGTAGEPLPGNWAMDETP